MLVGVLSDTHGRLSGQTLSSLAGSDYIIHAGDIGNPAILDELAIVAPVIAVLGNNDYPEYGTDVRRYARPIIEDVRFLVAHFPQDVCISYGASSLLSSGDPIPRVCIHGHTHIPRLTFGPEARPADFILCPGSASFPRGGFPPSVAFIDLHQGCIRSTRVESVQGEVLFTC